jgi:molybdopterin synthase sulfur carrier subunit
MRELTGGETKVEVEGGTVREVLEALEARFPGLRARLVKDDRIRAGLTVFIDGANNGRRLRTKVEHKSELYFVEALGGGAGTSKINGALVHHKNSLQYGGSTV